MGNKVYRFKHSFVIKVEDVRREKWEKQSLRKYLMPTG